MKRIDAIKYISWIIDEHKNVLSTDETDIKPSDTLVGWQCGFEPLFVAVRSEWSKNDNAEIAEEFLKERKWFSDINPEKDNSADYVF